MSIHIDKIILRSVHMLCCTKGFTGLIYGKDNLKSQLANEREAAARSMNLHEPDPGT